MLDRQERADQVDAQDLLPSPPASARRSPASPPEMPALAKKMSSPPCSLRPRSSIRPVDVRLAPGIGGDHAVRLARRRRPRSPSRPRAANRAAVALPIPDAAPGDDRDRCPSSTSAGDLTRSRHSPTPIVAAAVDDDRLAGHEGRGRRGEEHGGAGDFVRLADPAAAACACVTAFSVSGFSHSALAKSVLIRPGAMQLTRTCRGPNSAARLRASWKSAALEML